MKLLTEIEQYLVKVWGNEYYTTKNKIDFSTSSVAFSKAVWSKPTVLMAVKPPIGFDYQYGSYFLLKNEPIKFFLYDRETELVFGCISQIEMVGNWQKKLFYKIITAEDRMKRSVCPDCGFWLLERATQYGHGFIGCSGFPDCTYSAEIEMIYDDEY